MKHSWEIRKYKWLWMLPKNIVIFWTEGSEDFAIWKFKRGPNKSDYLASMVPMINTYKIGKNFFAYCIELRFLMTWLVGKEFHSIHKTPSQGECIELSFCGRGNESSEWLRNIAKVTQTIRGTATTHVRAFHPQDHSIFLLACASIGLNILSLSYNAFSTKNKHTNFRHSCLCSLT